MQMVTFCRLALAALVSCIKRRCLESAVRSPCNFSGSVLPSGYFNSMLDSNSETYVVC